MCANTIIIGVWTMILQAVIVFFAIVIVGVGVLIDKRGFSDARNAERDVQEKFWAVGQKELERDFPAGTKIIVDNSAGKGWRQTGMMPIDVDSAMDWLTEYMRAKGCYREHKVEQGKRILSEWSDEKGGRFMWMLWPANGKTGFSWGDVK